MSPEGPESPEGPASPEKPGSPGEPGQGEETDQLRQEVAGLRNTVTQLQRQRSGRIKRKLRTVVAIVLIVIASIVAPIALFTVFLRSVVFNTDQYLSIVGPLSKEPAIASVVADQVTNQLFTRVNVENRVKAALPKRAAFLGEPLSNTIRSATRTTTYKIVISDRFHQVWVNANRRMHQALVGVLTGTGGSAVTADKSGTVKLDLHTLAEKTINSLNAQGITIFNRIPVNKIGGEVTIIKAPGLVKLQGLTSWLNKLAWLLPFLSLACFGAAIGASWRRRRTILACGIGLATSMGVLAIALGLARSFLLDHAAGHAFTPAAAAVLFDALLNFPQFWLGIFFIVGIVTILVAWIIGPSRPAVAVRRVAASSARAVGSGSRRQASRLAPAERWLGENEGLVLGVVGIAALVILVVWGNPGIVSALITVVVAGGVMLLVHLVARWSRSILGIGLDQGTDQTKAP